MGPTCRNCGGPEPPRFCGDCGQPLDERRRVCFAVGAALREL